MLRGQRRRFLCFTLEDEFRTVKKYGETRIPPGRYRVTLRRRGGFHQRYEERFPHIHKGMLWIRDVPGFEYVLLHCGNTDDDTAGCLLVGDVVTQNVTSEGSLADSTAASRRIYPVLAALIESGEDMPLSVTDVDTPIQVDR
jgi:hypothetical protein